MDMLSYRRPHGSVTEKLFLDRYVSNLPNAYRDTSLNWHVDVADSTGVVPPVLWSCHTDTVSRKEGRQDVYMDKTGFIRLTRKAKKRSNCLGADDTVGVFLCREMILAGVPGHYVFHYGEEVGGIGSGDLARRDPKFLEQCQYAIAFDRRGTRDIITHQAWGRCASDAFAHALADQLNAMEFYFAYKPCDGGIYTDTAEYTNLIPECTNISVGYYNEHSSDEYVDAIHVMWLLAALLKLDISALPVERQAEDDDDWTFMLEQEAKQSKKVKRVDKWEKLFRNLDEKTDYVEIQDDEADWEYSNATGWTRVPRQFVDTNRGLAKTRGPYARHAQEYLDPEWEQIQRVFEQMDARKVKVN